MRERVNCDQALDLLQDYLKRELTPEVMSEVQRHLDCCRPCLEQSRFEARFLALVQASAPKQCCPDSVRERIIDLLRSKPRGS